MTWLRVSALGLGLLVACDKTVPFENTSPIKMGQTTTPPNMDGGQFVLLDASLGSSDGAMGPEIPAESFSRPALLKQIADCTLSRYREFNDLAVALQSATVAWAASPSDSSLAAAQLAWRKAMSSWQRAEPFSFGPAGPASTAAEVDPGGMDLRNGIYFYPNINLCLVDQTILKSGYTKLPLSLDVSAKGLGALEYLMFHGGPDNACSPAIAINSGSPSPWAMITPSDLAQRRAAFASALATDLVNTAKALLDAWDPTAGNFYTKFSSAGTSGSIYASDQAAFNTVSNAMFYVGKQLKDSKLGIPAGLLTDCMTTTCPDRVESRYSQASNDDLLQNLQGFRLLFQGCGGNYTGLGFDDWLVFANHGDLATRIIAATAVVQQATSALPLPLEQQIATNNAAVVAVHADVIALYDLLKNEFVSTLSLSVPKVVASDND